MSKETAIRLIGDPILQKAGLPFPTNATPTEREALALQQKIATALLIESGGAGIAANQCAAIPKPYQLIIVGVYHENPTHLTRVAKRYPGVTFPEAQLMLNPSLLKSSEENLGFYHGCLSIPGNLRAELKTPQEITVAYQKLLPEGRLEREEATLSGFPAVVLQHELNHILYGKTYFDCCLAHLNHDDKKALLEALLEEEKKREQQKESAPLLAPPLNEDFYRFIHLGEKGETTLDRAILKKALSTTLSSATISGLKKQVLL
jgi:peptide deformylase